MELAGIQMSAWLDRGPAHQLFRSDDGRLVYRVLPTASKDVREAGRSYVARVAEALGQEGAAVPGDSQLHVGDDGELLFSTEDPVGRSTLNFARPLPPVMALGLASRILQGLGPIHALGVYHGALSPGRILLGGDGDPIIADMGITYLTEADADRRLAPSVPGFAELYPTAAFIPPEVFNWKPLSPASDIFLIAALVYRWMAGKPAHEGERVMDVYSALRDGRRSAFPKLPANLNLEAIRLLEAALDPDPEARPSAPELVKALRPFAGIALNPLMAQAGEERPFSSGFTELNAADAPGPPGSAGEKRRQEVLKRATLQLEVMKTQREGGQPIGPATGRPFSSKRAGRSSGNLWSWVVVVALLAGIGALTPYLLDQFEQRRGEPPPATRADPRTDSTSSAASPDASSTGQPRTLPTVATGPRSDVPSDAAARPLSNPSGPAGAPDGAPKSTGELVVAPGDGRVRLDIKRRQPEIEIHQGRYLVPQDLPQPASPKKPRGN